MAVSFLRVPDPLLASALESLLGTLPAQLTQLSLLTFLDVANDTFVCGPLPAAVGLLVRGSPLYLTDNFGSGCGGAGPAVAAPATLPAGAVAGVAVACGAVVAALVLAGLWLLGCLPFSLPCAEDDDDDDDSEYIEQPKHTFTVQPLHGSESVSYPHRL